MGSDKITLATDWRDGSGVESTGWASRLSGFVFQHLPGNSQPSETLVPGDLKPSTSLNGARQVCTRYTDIHTGQTPLHISKIINKKDYSGCSIERDV